ncbi:hypothetical protein ND747_28815 [Frankia sp. R82]|nr:hypothetical protein [Frankia sp. R82]
MKVLLAASILIAPVGISVESALASGQSPRTNNCYSTWGSTGSNAHCYANSVAGTYTNHGFCTSQPDPTSSKYFVKGTYAPDWGQVNCWFKINSSRVDFHG